MDAQRRQPGQKAIDNYMVRNPQTTELVETAVAAVLYVYATPAASAAFSAYWTEYYSYYSTGNIWAARRGAAVSLATSAAMYGVGSLTQGGDSWAVQNYGVSEAQFLNVVGHAAVGCASAAASGGDCGQGAAGAAAAWDNYGMKSNDVLYNLTTTSLVGGTASVLSGGKFANGARTAAFGYLFNYCMHDGKCFTISSERALLNKGDFAGYYKEACAGNDAYACQAGDIAAGKSFPAVATTTRLIDYAADNGVLMTQDKLNDIRLKLATSYANYLGDSVDMAKIPSAMSIAQFHWDVFDSYGLPPRAFGGTPLGTMGGTWFTKQYPAFIGGGTGWCPKCAP